MADILARVVSATVITVSAAFLVFGTACTFGSNGGSEEVDDEATGGLPNVAAPGNEDCDEVEQLSGCTWAMSTDAVLVGAVSEVEPIVSPTVPADSSEDGLHEDCDGAINPGLEITLEITTVLKEDELAAGDEVDVHVGTTPIDGWNPYPNDTDEGDVEWNHVGDGGGDPIVEGMELGVGIHWSEEYGVWSTMREPLFRVGDEGLEFQSETAGCDVWPDEWDGFQLDQLETAVASCEQTQAAQERSQQVYSTSQRTVFAGSCITGDGENELEEGECLGDSDCRGGETCVDGECVAAD